MSVSPYTVSNMVAGAPTPTALSAAGATVMGAFTPITDRVQAVLDSPAVAAADPAVARLLRKAAKATLPEALQMNSGTDDDEDDDAGNTASKNSMHNDGDKRSNTVGTNGGDGATVTKVPTFVKPYLAGEDVALLTQIQAVQEGIVNALQAAGIMAAGGTQITKQYDRQDTRDAIRNDPGVQKRGNLRGTHTHDNTAGSSDLRPTHAKEDAFRNEPGIGRQETTSHRRYNTNNHHHHHTSNTH